MVNHREQCLEAGCNDYLCKPLTPDDLFGTISDYLSQPTSKTHTDISGTTRDFRGLMTAEYITDVQRAKWLARFIGGLQDQVERLEDALREEDISLLIHTVHSLHGTAASFGFDCIAGTALEIEKQAVSGVDLQELQDTAAELMNLCTQVVRVKSNN